MIGVAIKRLSKYTFLVLLIFWGGFADVVHCESSSDIVKKEIISKINELNQKIISYKANYTLQIKKPSAWIIDREKRGSILYSRKEGKIKNLLVDLDSNKKAIMLYDAKKKLYFSYVPSNNIFTYAKIDELEKELNRRIDPGYFITDINNPFSKIITDELHYVGIEKLEGNWTYHFKYKQTDLWINIEDGLLYRKKTQQKDREILFAVEKVEKNIFIAPEEFEVEVLNNVEKTDITEEWFHILKKTISRSIQ